MDLLSREDLEVVAIEVVVDGGEGPGDADAKEDVDCVGTRHVTNGGVSVRVLLGGHLRRECV